jgi:hypothetical protein
MIQKNDIVLVSKKITDRTIWVTAMDEIVGNGVAYVVAGTMFDNHAILPEAGYVFLFDCLEVIGRVPEVKQQAAEVPEAIYHDPTYSKTVFVNGSEEEFHTKREAMIDYYECRLKSLINQGSYLNMETVLENTRSISMLMKEIEHFDVLNMEK